MEQHGLSAEKVLAVWETGRTQHPLDRALTILAAASAGATRDALADLPIGERDARLLELRTQLLGPRAEGFAECPHCGERVEFPLDLGTLALEGRAPSRPADVSTPCEIEANGITIGFRLPTSRDLAASVAAPDPPVALRALIDRCAGKTDLPDDIVEKISAAMLEADPQAEVLLRLSCPVCAHAWELLFDIADFLWTEIAALAERLLREIDALARAYGWTEREILALPALRRQTYLELVAA